MVNIKKPKNKLNKSEVIPKIINGFKTDVLPSKMIQQRVRVVNPRQVIRPVIGGVQIQSDLYHTTSYWGTIGCFYNINNQLFGITNYHVLYGGATHDIVLDQYANKMKVCQNFNNHNTQIGIASGVFDATLDYATFFLQVPSDQIQSINNISGIVNSYAYPQIGMSLVKSGASTGVTFGLIDGRSCFECSELSVFVDRNYNTTDTISDYGDSGSIWVLNDNSGILKPVALHYAGGQDHRWAKAKAFTSIFASIRNKVHTPT